MEDDFLVFRAVKLGLLFRRKTCRHMTQTPDEKTYVEFPFIDQLKGMWTLFLVPTQERGDEKTFYLARVKSRFDPAVFPSNHDNQARLLRRFFRTTHGMTPKTTGYGHDWIIDTQRRFCYTRSTEKRVLINYQYQSFPGRFRQLMRGLVGGMIGRERLDFLSVFRRSWKLLVKGSLQTLWANVLKRR